MVLADDGPAWRADPVEQARAACDGGAAIVQLRSKHATDRDTLDWAGEIRALTRRSGVQFFVNDRFDLALLAEADGVHLGQHDIAPDRIPARWRARLSIGCSTHTLAQVDEARAQPVDYIAFGPIFGTHSKDSAYEARGLELLAEAVRRAAPGPVVAIGGIDHDNAERVAQTGVAAIAVISSVAASDDPVAATRRLIAAIARPGEPPTPPEPFPR